ncbi:MAG TPA: Glu/Leu/Phe/Val dehydrogenase dimerization domain-containing protein [Acidobacteriota bacterium]|nr:Glu/Leu/Phe/Val dehydrogenase dimerization domain-containing protein [Acidobacteriota bacterium]
MKTPYFDRLQRRGHEAVYFCRDRGSGLRALIAFHDTTLGPAAGGTRRWAYADEEEALQDVLRLSEGMTLKCSAAGLNNGGGKIVMLAEPGAAPRREQYRALGRFIDRFQGHFVTGEDVGTGDEQLRWISQTTRWVVGLPAAGMDKPETSAQTALGVRLGMKACLRRVVGKDDLEGVRVAVQGLGHVGMKLARALAREGARLVVSEVDPGKAQEAAGQLGAEVIEPQEIYRTDCDVFAPCALGGVLNSRTVESLRCRVVAGSANNQLGQDGDAERLHERQIAYLPDFVINAGGAIDNLAMLDPQGYDADRVEEQIRKIPDRIERLLDISLEHGISTQKAALHMARERLETARQARKETS